MADFYLASASPRRRDLLRQVGARFETLLLRVAAPRGPDVPEVPAHGEEGAQYVLRVATGKAEAGRRAALARGLLHRPVLGADTEVILDGEVLGKPRDLAHAAQMLRRLAGREHEVLTAIAIAPAGPGAAASRLSVSRVWIRALSDEEIARYCAGREPLGKAGAYALQGRGAAFVERVEGSCSGIVGLPLSQTVELLAGAGILLP